MTTKLSSARLGSLDSRISVPQYDRALVTPGIVHIGVGGFHRAHQTVYTEDLFNENGSFVGQLAEEAVSWIKIDRRLLSNAVAEGVWR